VNELARDAHNKSKLSDFQEEILKKVVESDEYKEVKYVKPTSSITNDRLVLTGIYTVISEALNILIPGDVGLNIVPNILNYLNVPSELYPFLYIPLDFVLMYIILRIILNDDRVRMQRIVFKKLFGF
jgi:hypothetical protein